MDSDSISSNITMQANGIISAGVVDVAITNAGNEKENFAEMPSSNNVTTMSAPAPKLTIEQAEEEKLRNKYPSVVQKPGSSTFLSKIMNKGNKKYFDSGDYNMAKSKMKSKQPGMESTLAEGEASSINITTPPAINIQVCTNASTTSEVAAPSCESHKTLNTSTDACSGEETVSTGVCEQLTPETSRIGSTTPTHRHISPSISSSSLAEQHLLDQDAIEIGKEIATSGVLATRKHSIVQSKLATPNPTPRLSTTSTST